MGDALYVGLEHIAEGSLALTGTGKAPDVTSTKTRFRRNDILFGKLRPYFRKVVRAPSDGICSTDIWVVRSCEGVDQKYLYYCMASEQFVDFAAAGSEGTRMPRAIWSHASEYRLSLPPLNEQRGIARVLGTLDDKIELNRRLCETLEEMARALFKSWFVDFEPVRAKMEGRWRRGESLAGLRAEHYDLFPDDLVPSDLGPIPDGWQVGALERVVEHFRQSANPQDFPEVLFEHHSIPAFDRAQIAVSELGSEIKSIKLRMRSGAVLVSRVPDFRAQVQGCVCLGHQRC